MSKFLDDYAQRKNPKYDPRPEPTPIPEAAWNSTPLLCLSVNEEWASHIIGLLEVLDQSDTWVGTPEEIEAARENVRNIVAAIMTTCGGDVIYPKHATFWHDEATITVGNDLLRTTLANAPFNIANSFYNTSSYQNPGANGDTFEQIFLITEGNYRLFVLGAKNSVHGILKWFVDDSEVVSSQDWYASSVQANIIQTSDIEISGDGEHILIGVVTGKNGSSGGYYMPLTKYWLERLP